MTVVEISECFPDTSNPVTGEFILQHVRALSKYCKVITIVPLRYVPPKELISFNPSKTFSGIVNWMISRSRVVNSSGDNPAVIYFPYISLLRPYFESIDNSFIKFFFHRRLNKLIRRFKPDIIYCNWLRPWAEVSFRQAQHLGIPFIIDHHEDIPTLKKLFPQSFSKFLRTFQKADGIVVHSSLNRKQWIEENLNIPDVKINYYGQNFTVNNSEKKFNTGLCKIICVSHLSEKRKNIDDLIRAIAILKTKTKVLLSIAGDGILKNEYVTTAESLDLTKEITFHGRRTQSEIDYLLEESDIFVLPSYPEAFGIVFIEALAKGLPVITCEGNGGGEELRLLDYPVVLVKPNSPADLAEGILKLVNDRDKMSEMSESGKQIVQTHFTWEKNAYKTYEYLVEIINKDVQK